MEDKDSDVTETNRKKTFRGSCYTSCFPRPSLVLGIMSKRWMHDNTRGTVEDEENCSEG